MAFEIIDSNGPVAIGTERDFLAIRSDGMLRAIHLDANLAVDLSKIGAGKIGPGTTVATDVLRLAVVTNSAIDYDLAVAELALGAARASGDKTRAATLVRDIAAGIRAVEAHLGLRAGSVPVGHLGQREVDSYRGVHLGAYTHLLRIEQIAKLRRGKAAALQNVSEYIRWANDYLKNISAHCLQVALDVFGGEPRAARLLGVTSSKPQESRAWNAAWDIVHAVAMHSETTRPVGRTMKRALLATRDQALSYVARRCVVAVHVRASPLGDTTLAGSKIDQPFLIDRREEVSAIIREVFHSQRRRIDRADRADSASRRDLSRVRNELERELGIRPSA